MTQKEIAKRLGMSQMTVSYALSGSKKVSEETRKRVLAMATKLGYHPHHAARSLRSGRTGLVAPLGLELNDGLIHSLSTDESVIVHLARCLQAHEMSLSARYAISAEERFRLPPWQVDAAALIHASSIDECAEVESAGIPYVSINGVAGPSGSRLVPDDRDGMLQVMDHLFELGHQRIVFALPATCWLEHASVADRRDAYVEAMAGAGFAPHPSALEPIVDRNEFVRSVVGEYHATAIIAYHTFFAVELLQTCQVLGFSVPVDVSLVSFNDVYPAEQLHPKLTCISLPVEEMGKTAADLLVKQIGTDKRITKIVPFKERLTIRQSTAPPKASHSIP